MSLRRGKRDLRFKKKKKKKKKCFWVILIGLCLRFLVREVNWYILLCQFFDEMTSLTVDCRVSETQAEEKQTPEGTPTNKQTNNDNNSEKKTYCEE